MSTETHVSDTDVIVLFFIIEALILFASLVASVSSPVLGATIAAALFCYVLHQFPFLAEVF
jgi:uncharacterized oligopeptide transporter (OPT) family protein